MMDSFASCSSCLNRTIPLKKRKEVERNQFKAEGDAERTDFRKIKVRNLYVGVEKEES